MSEMTVIGNCLIDSGLLLGCPPPSDSGGKEVLIDCHCVVCHGRFSPWRSIIGVVPQKQPDFSVAIDVEHRRPHLHPRTLPYSLRKRRNFDSMANREWSILAEKCKPVCRSLKIW